MVGSKAARSERHRDCTEQSCKQRDKVQEFFGAVEMFWLQEHVATEALDKSAAAGTANKVANIVSSDCTKGRARDNDRKL